MTIKNQTKLQTKILAAAKGHNVQEVVHAFEVIKLCLLTGNFTK